MPAWEDLDPFLSMADFGVEATITKGETAPMTVAVIFDEAGFEPSLGDLTVDATTPRITGKATDLAGISRGDVVVIGDRTFAALAAAQPDGTGMATLRLAAE